MVAILWRNNLPIGALPGALIMIWSFAAFLGMGLIPFHSYMAGLSSAPAILTLFLVPLGVPLLGALSFIEMMATQGPLINDTWRTILITLAIISAVGTAVGAIGATRLRALLGWHASNQFALLILAAMSDTQVMVLGVPILLVSSILTTSVIALAVALSLVAIVMSSHSCAHDYRLGLQES
jgi:formate hydrogenlyase subunit 3/multisubunit Na+/H+ antiporter MnhD subunit